MKKQILTLGEKIEDLLKQKNLTQSEFCKQNNLNIQTLSMIITNERKDPRISTLIPIAKGLGVSVDYLLGLDDVPSINAENKSINKALGLTEKAILQIKALNNPIISEDCENKERYEINSLNRFLENDNLFRMLYNLNQYYTFNNIEQNNPFGYFIKDINNNQIGTNFSIYEVQQSFLISFISDLINESK